MAEYTEGTEGTEEGEIMALAIQNFSNLSVQDISSNEVKMRVREVIPHLPVPQWLINNKCIYDLSEFNNTETKRYPPWVFKTIGPFLDPENKKRTNTVTTFGVLVEHICKHALADASPDVKWPRGEDILESTEAHPLKPEELYNGYVKIVQVRTNKNLRTVLSLNKFRNSHNFFKGMYDGTRRVFEEFKNSQMEFGAVISCVKSRDGIEYTWEGHPDIIGEDYVIDIKCTSSFKTHLMEHYLQVLSYYSLANRTGKWKNKIKHIGIYLPLQHDLIYIDLKDWDDTKFCNEAFTSIYRCNERQINRMSIPFGILNQSQQAALTRVGSHVGRTGFDGKKANLIDNITGYIQRTGIPPVPVQIYINSNIAGAKDTLFDDKTVNDIRLVVDNLNLPLFVHAPNNINPSTETVDGWGVKRIKAELEMGQRLGARGVVMHIGKATKSSEARSLDQMEKFIRECLSSATEDCPLLLETPAGQGSELCVKFSEFSKFYSRFTAEEHKVFKICIDTCHVYAAGYEPFDYIRQWLKLFPRESLRLVHFNDSKNPKGCCVDRHAVCGTGYIGTKELKKVRDLCVMNDVCMVTE